MSSSVPPMPPPRRKIGSRACDGCKIRKVRCSGAPAPQPRPCTRCLSIGIECTFNKRQSTRGPRSLRAKTLAEIRRIQETHGGSGSGGGGSPHHHHHYLNHHLTDAATFSANGVDTGESNRHEPPTVAAAAAAKQGSGTGPETAPPSSSPQPQAQAPPPLHSRRTPVSSLIVRLCIFRLRLFPVWPILDAEAVIASLLTGDPSDLETYALANAVCAAIIAQLKLPFEGRTDDHDPATAASMASECARAKAALLSGQDQNNNDDDEEEEGVVRNLNMLRISFFQHIYHENLRPGGSKSLLFLREAITIAQIMGLHQRGTYRSLAPEASQMRRRIIWLLFVTERGVAMLHKLPTVLVWQAKQFPALVVDDTCVVDHEHNHQQQQRQPTNRGKHADKTQDEAHILPAFKKLVHLFWVFDQGGAFDIILNADADADDSDDAATDPDPDPDRSDSQQQQQQRSTRLAHLQRRLQDMSSSWAEELESNEVQQADILVTQSWMQAVLWRASVRRRRPRHAHYAAAAAAAAWVGVATAASSSTSCSSSSSTLQDQQNTGMAAGPYRIVNEFLSHISHYSKTALEAHGPTIELKIFEIASALTDALASNLDLLHSSSSSSSSSNNNNNNNDNGNNSNRSNCSTPSGLEDISIRPVEMLVQLQRLLASSRGGNKPLLTMLCARIAEVENGGPPHWALATRDMIAPGLANRENAQDHDDDNDDDDDDDDEGAAAADGIIALGMASTGYATTTTHGVRRTPSPAASYLDMVRLGYPSPLPVWPGMRSDPSHQQNNNNNNNFSVDPGGHLGITFAQMTNESWNAWWTLDLASMSQISML